MTSSKTSKILKRTASHPDVKFHYDLLAKRGQAFEDLLKNFWFRLLVPKKWQSILCEALVELRVAVLAKNKFMKLIVEQSVELETYKHNSLAQKEKTKRYSELRKRVRDNKNDLDIPVHVDYSHFHEHEKGL